MGMTAGLAFMAGGTAFSAVSQRKQGQYSQQLQNINAGFADVQAEDAVARGAEQEQRFRTQIKQQIGTARASYASQNVDVGVGTPVDVQASIAYMGELDALTIRNNAAREAWGYKVEAYNHRMQGTLDRYTGNVSSVSTILGSVSNYYKMGGWSSSGGSGGSSGPTGYANMGVGNAPRGMG
jgi:hypothetical protein